MTSWYTAKASKLKGERIIRIKLALSALAIAVLTVIAPASVNAAPKAKVASTSKAPVVYTVQSGDSLSKIAQQYGTTWQKLFNKNTDIKNPHLIYVDEKVTIPEASENLPERAAEAPEAVPAPAPVPTPAPAPVAQPAVVQSGCGDNDLAHFIYMKESTCNTNATNGSGCYGIGQDCNGVLKPLCGADYSCQNAFFNDYAQRRYGGWEGAYAFWLNNNWW